MYHRKRYIHKVLNALEDGATNIPRLQVQAQLCFALFMSVASLGVIFLATNATQEESCINSFGDRNRPCPGGVLDNNRECYQRVDVHGHVLYTRDRNGFHFEMNPFCSMTAPENDVMKCRGEWSFIQDTEVVWYLRRYHNVTSNAESLVSLPALKDRELHLMAMRWIPRSSDLRRSTWVFSSSSIPRDDFPEAEVVMDGTVVVGQMVVESNK